MSSAVWFLLENRPQHMHVVASGFVTVSRRSELLSPACGPAKASLAVSLSIRREQQWISLLEFLVSTGAMLLEGLVRLSDEPGSLPTPKVHAAAVTRIPLNRGLLNMFS